MVAARCSLTVRSVGTALQICNDYERLTIQLTSKYLTGYRGIIGRAGSSKIVP